MMSDKLFLTTLNGTKLKQTPIWFMRQAGRYLEEYRAIRAVQKDFIGFCLNPQQASAVTLQPIARYSLDAAIIFSDILIVPWAMNLNVRFEKNTGPLLDPIEQPDMIDASSLKELTKKLTPVAEAIKLTSISLPKETALIGFAGSSLDINYVYCRR